MHYQNRLLLVGPARDLKAFDRLDWMKDAGAKHVELLEASPTRCAWQFETADPILSFLRKSSQHWPTLTFLLDYDCEDHLKGLVKARKGRVRHCWVRY